MRTELSDFIVHLLTESKKFGLKVVDEKVIPYGVQYKFGKGDSEIPVNIYYSDKKGISPVVGGSPRNDLRPLLLDLLNKKAENVSLQHNWKIWAGTDESGKGDFFGPLVVCGFIATEQTKEKLLQIGVKDSKLMKDSEIEKTAKLLYKNFPGHMEVIVLKPVKYNELYEKFRSQGKKLNEMLAWMHGRIILNLKNKHDFEGVVVDKFAGDKTLVSSLKQ
ncbi:MAG: ribonuclease HIII, partial [Candidatus Cloacimonadota bacterium]